MTFTSNNNTVIIHQNQDDLETFLDNFKSHYSTFVTQHIILELNSKDSLKTNLIQEINNLSLDHQKHDKSFVVVYADYNLSEWPDTLNIAPTLQEANDIIEMEEMQRDLGF